MIAPEWMVDMVAEYYKGKPIEILERLYKQVVEQRTNAENSTAVGSGGLLEIVAKEQALKKLLNIS